MQGAKRPGPKRLSSKSPGAKTLSEPSLSLNFLYDCDSPWGFFIIVRFFYYYHLNLIYDSLIGLT